MYTKFLNNFLKVTFIISFSICIIFISNNNFISTDSFKYLLSGKQIFLNKFLPLYNDAFYPAITFDRTSWLFDIFVYINSQYLGIGIFKYYKILFLFFSFFISFLIINKRLQGKYITIALFPSVFAAYIILFLLKMSPEIFNLFLFSCFLYIIERIPSKRNKNLYFLLPILSLFWANIDIISSVIINFISFFYLLYRYYELKEQPEKEEKYFFNIFIIPFLIILIINIFVLTFINNYQLIYKYFDINKISYKNFFKFSYISFYIYIIFYFLTIFLNLKGADIGRKAELIKDIIISIFLLFICIFDINKIFLFLIFSIPVISYYVYLIFKWDFVWKYKWTERNLIFIKNIIFLCIIPSLFIFYFIFDKINKKDVFPYNVVRYLNNETISRFVLVSENIKYYTGYFLYPDYKILNKNSSDIKNLIKNNKINIIFLIDDFKTFSILLNGNYKISYFDDNLFVFVNPEFTKKYFKYINPVDLDNFFYPENFDNAKNELEKFTNLYPSEKAMLYLARLYKSKDINLAIKFLDEKISEFPYYYNLYNYLAELLYEIEDYENSYEIAKKSRIKNSKIINLMNKIKSKNF